jgi:hypothetical protein
MSVNNNSHCFKHLKYWANSLNVGVAIGNLSRRRRLHGIHQSATLKVPPGRAIAPMVNEKRQAMK